MLARTIPRAARVGRVAAFLFASEGAQVAVVDIVPSGAEETVQLIREIGDEATFVNPERARLENTKLSKTGSLAKRIGRHEKVTKTVLFLASDEAS